MNVSKGLYYYKTDRQRPAAALKSGIPTGWNDEWFSLETSDNGENKR